MTAKFHLKPAAASRLVVALSIAMLGLNSGQAAGILGSKHDLSVAGPGPIKAVTESDVCLFCHTPHKGTGQTPLWNHSLSSATYTPYDSSTMKATIGQPTGASKLCLSCHDGTVALGMVSSRSTPIRMQGALKEDIAGLPAGASLIGTDLSDDHPISFTYDSALATADGQLKDPSTLNQKVRLDHDKQLQCTSCHDPHDDQFGNFLVQDNTASSLCLQCHVMNYWQNSVHRTSSQNWSGAGADPWPHTKETTVAANGCENCHAPHNAGTRPRLLNFADEEQNCFSCHNGNVAAKNIQPEFNKVSTHPVLSTSGVHDPTEDPINPRRHVECADCHDSHAANKVTANRPNASGALAGVTGVTSSGAVVKPLSYEYELCFRCHGDSVSRGPGRVNRQVAETNTRLEFSPSAQSYHPVVAVGKNQNVPSLVAPWTTSSLVYCTDCHNNNQGPNAGGAGPNGPHGSTYTPLLERNLTIADFQAESYSTYELCYKCHERNNILSDQSFKSVNGSGEPRGHRFHVVDQQTACTTCHDSHGVVSTAHLINFNTSYVTPLNGLIEFKSTGIASGNCTLTCHGKEHPDTPYPGSPLLSAPRNLRRSR